MQKRLLFIACLLLAIGQKMVAADGSDLITISDFSIYSGQSKEIGIELTNRDVYVGFQFDLQLPQGFTVSTYSANASRIPDGTSLRMAQQTDGSYRFVAAALDGSEISGNSGTVVNITVAADQSLTESSYTGYIRAIKLSKADGSGTTVSEEQPFTITVKGSDAYAALSDNNTVLTFYYDDQIDNRGGMSVADHGWSQFAGSITKVKFDSTFANYSPTSTAYWFSEMSALASIEGIDLLSTVNVTDMQYMFFNCSSLTTLEVSGFKTENVTNMYRMFYGCSGLTSLDVSRFTTDNVTAMDGMFALCSKLTTLDLSSFNTSKVTNMNSMFSDCTSLTTIYVGDGWTLGSLQSGSGLFDNCTNLKGGAGTTYNSRHTDSSYAHIDGGESNPGYLTDAGATGNFEVYAIAKDATITPNRPITATQSVTMTPGNESAWSAGTMGPTTEPDVVLDLSKYYNTTGSYTFGGSIKGTNTPRDGELTTDESTGEITSSGNQFIPAYKNLPKSGAYVVYQASQNGSLIVPLRVVADKSFFVVDGKGNVVTDIQLKDEQGNIVALRATPLCSVSDTFTGFVSFNVTKDEQYYIFVTGSGATRYGGFVFSPESITIDPATMANVLNELVPATVADMEIFAVDATTEVKSNTAIATTQSVTMTPGNDTGWDNGLLVSSKNAINFVASKYYPSSTSTYTFWGCTRGQNSAKDGELADTGSTGNAYNYQSKNSPRSGEYMSFEASRNGSLILPISVPLNKPLYVIDGEGKAMTDIQFIDTLNAAVPMLADPLCVFSTEKAIPGFLSFNVKQGEKYTIFINGGKDLRYGGYIFNDQTIDIDPATMAAVRDILDPKEDVTVQPASGGDIAEAVNRAMEGKRVGKVTVELESSGSYTFNNTITLPGSLNFLGNGATIDASALEGNMFQMVDLDTPDDWTTVNFIMSEFTLKNLKQPLFYSNSKNYLFDDFALANVNVQLAASVTPFNFTKGSVTKIFSLVNSTFWAPEATSLAFYSTQSGQKPTEADPDATQTFKLHNCTMYNLTKGRNFFSHRQASQVWLTYDVQNNIFVNCGKSGQVIKGLNGGQTSSNPTWSVKANLFNFDGADTGSMEETGDTTEGETVEGTVAGVISFVDAANGDFSGEVKQSQVVVPDPVPGDPRWNVSFVQSASEPYARLENEVLTFYYDANKTDTDYAITYYLNPQGCPWYQSAASIKSVNFTESFKDYTPTSTAFWFYGMEQLETLDLGNLIMTNVTNTSGMFTNCSSLTTITVNNTWPAQNGAEGTITPGGSGSSVTGSDMFNGCTSLKGGAGTVYDANHVDYAYAHIDGGTNNPGYFTDINVPIKEDITVQPASGVDIAEAVNRAMEGKNVGNVTIELEAKGSYTMSSSITVPGSLAILGNEAVVDASALEDNMFQMVELVDPTEWTTVKWVMSAFTVKGLKKPLFYSNSRNYLFEIFSLDNMNVEQAANVSTFDFTKGSAVRNFNLENSTFWAPEGTSLSFYTSQAGQKVTDADESATQVFYLHNNTMYNLAKSVNFFTQRTAGMSWMAFDVQNNIFVDCGKPGQTITGLNGGGNIAAPTWTVKGNLFNFEAADTSSEEEARTTSSGETGGSSFVENSVRGVISFVDAANGNFNGEVKQTQVVVPDPVPGDPRWTLSFAQSVLEPYAVLSENNTVMTFFYDDQKQAKGGMDVGPFVYDSKDKRGWSPYTSQITKAVFDQSFDQCTTLTSTAFWFTYMTQLETIEHIEYLHTDNVEDMNCMFDSCYVLRDLDVSHFVTAKVRNMQCMFNRCEALTSLNLSNFNTSSCTFMRGMFYDCKGLTSLDLSSFNTSNNTSTEYMFQLCSSLENIIFGSGFSTENVTNMRGMFDGCSSLKSLNVGGFNTQKVSLMSIMFRGCSSLTSLDVSSFNTANVTDMAYMFERCSVLTSLDLSHFSTEKVTDMSFMFSYCIALTSLDLGGFNTANVTDMSGMFLACTSLTSLDVSGFNTQQVTNMQDMFRACTNLTSLDLSRFNTQNVTEMYGMFYNCTNLKSLDLSNFDTRNVRNMDHLFRFCTNLVNLNISGFSTANVTDMGYMFEGCSSLASIQAGNAVIADSIYAQIENPNLLLYVNEASQAPQSVRNVVVFDVAEQIVLKDTVGNNNFFCPKQFTAKRISYTHNYKQATQVGVSRGWETIALPFSVQTITHEKNGTLVPFGVDGGKPFWLRELTENGLVSARRIEAYVPYLISMPNNSIYPADYNQAGNVTFSATDAVVAVTEQRSASGNNRTLIPTCQRVEQSASVYAINLNEAYESNPEGSIFVANYREVRPFEAYVEHPNGGARYYTLGDLADMDVTGLQAIHNIVASDFVKVYNLSGVLVKSGKRHEVIPYLTKGVYIINGSKVVIK